MDVTCALYPFHPLTEKSGAITIEVLAYAPLYAIRGVASVRWQTQMDFVSRTVRDGALKENLSSLWNGLRSAISREQRV
jgi:hypothetical protein